MHEVMLFIGGVQKSNGVPWGGISSPVVEVFSRKPGGSLWVIPVHVQVGPDGR